MLCRMIDGVFSNAGLVHQYLDRSRRKCQAIWEVEKILAAAHPPDLFLALLLRG